MRRHLLPAALAATALAATGGAAFAIAGSVSTSPAPLYISRTSPDGLSDHPDTTTAPTRPTSTTTVTPSTSVTSTTAPTTSTTATSTSVTTARDGHDRHDRPTTTAGTGDAAAARDDTQPDDHGGDRPRRRWRDHGSDDRQCGHGRTTTAGATVAATAPTTEPLVLRFRRQVPPEGAAGPTARPGCDR